MGRFRLVVVLGIAGAGLGAAAEACAPQYTEEPAPTAGDAGVDVADAETGAVAADATTCNLTKPPPSGRVAAQITFLDPPDASPLPTKGGALAGSFRVTASKLFLPGALKQIVDLSKSAGSAGGSATFEGARYRIDINATATISTPIGDRVTGVIIDSQGQYTVSGDAIVFDRACDPPDSGADAGFTYDSTASDTFRLVVKTPAETFGDAYVEITLTNK
ncbi:MAG: hypothetical protein JST00_40195 [Deltaproteobacteria bacterium]|nr:hypothetical protein [Deltaproteobacteria bacterium]